MRRPYGTAPCRGGLQTRPYRFDLYSSAIPAGRPSRAAALPGAAPASFRKLTGITREKFFPLLLKIFLDIKL